MDMSSPAEPKVSIENKLPLKRVELSLSKFNEVAIPHHLDLLRQHKANIIKYSESGEWGRVRAEQTAARRAAARLRALLAELDALRRAVRASDTPAFDTLTARAIADTRTAITDYTESSPMLMGRGGGGGGGAREPGGVAGSVTSSESVGVVRDGGEVDVSVQLQLQVEEEGEREAALRGWTELQEEVSALHATWRAVHEAAHAQRGHVERVGERVEVAGVHVEAARGHLAIGERLRGAAGGALGGAALGALAGGPVGLLVGLKAGAAAALAGSLLGYTAGRLLPVSWLQSAPAMAPAPTPTPGEHPCDKDKVA